MKDNIYWPPILTNKAMITRCLDLSRLKKFSASAIYNGVLTRRCCEIARGQTAVMALSQVTTHGRTMLAMHEIPLQRSASKDSFRDKIPKIKVNLFPIKT